MAGQKKLSAAASAALAFTALFTASLGQSGARDPEGETDVLITPPAGGDHHDQTRP